jgi:hypothetical protein
MHVPREYDESELARLAQAMDAVSLREASGTPRTDDAARRLSPAAAPPSSDPSDGGTSGRYGGYRQREARELLEAFGSDR